MTGTIPGELKVIRYEDIDLSALAAYPVLAACHRAWLDAGRNGNLPAAIDIAEIPAEALPYTMLLDYLPEQQDVRVRLCGHYVGERADFTDTGKGLRSFFNEQDARLVLDSLVDIARTAAPSLARRDYVSLEGKIYRYVRLIMPLSLDGRQVTGFFKTIEPHTLEISERPSGEAMAGEETTVP